MHWTDVIYCIYLCEKNQQALVKDGLHKSIQTSRDRPTITGTFSWHVVSVCAVSVDLGFLVEQTKNALAFDREVLYSSIKCF